MTAASGLLAACGSGQDPFVAQTAEGGAPTDGAGTPVAAPAADGDAPTFGSGRQADAPAADVAGQPQAAAPAPVPAEDGAPVPSSTAPPAPGSSAAPSTAPAPVAVFPDLAVQRIADRAPSTVSTELAGGGLPVMVWFWSPF